MRALLPPRSSTRLPAWNKPACSPCLVPVGVLRSPQPPQLLEAGGAGDGGGEPARAVAGRRAARHQPVAQVRHHGLPVRRHAASGHVRSEAQRAREIRGEFKPISTNVPGVQIGELLPKWPAPWTTWRWSLGGRLARRAFELPERDRLHDGHRAARRAAPLRFGDCAWQGRSIPVVPPFVDLFPTMQHARTTAPGRAYWPRLRRREGRWRRPGPHEAALRLERRFATAAQLLDSFDRSAARSTAPGSSGWMPPIAARSTC